MESLQSRLSLLEVGPMGKERQGWGHQEVGYFFCGSCMITTLIQISLTYMQTQNRQAYKHRDV